MDIELKHTLTSAKINIEYILEKYNSNSYLKDSINDIYDILEDIISNNIVPLSDIPILEMREKWNEIIISSSLKLSK